MIGWFFEIALIGLLLRSIDYGGGTDLWNVSKANYMHFTKVSTLPFSNPVTTERTAVIPQHKGWLTPCHS